MPDLKPVIYNRPNEFNDTGSVNVNVPGPYNVPDAPAFTERSTGDQAPPSPFDALNSISANLGALTAQENPFVKSLEHTTPYRTPLAETVRYDDPKYGFDPFNPDLENQYGDRQGWLTKWKNNLLKFGANVGGTFIESLATIPLVIDAAVKGDMSRIYNNPLSNAIGQWMDGLENSLPNYQTTFEKNHPVLNWVPFIGNSGDSWGSLLKNLGFTVGAIAGSALTDTAIGLATGGIGEAAFIEPQMMRIFGKLGKVFAAEKGATTFAQEAARAKDILDALDKTAKTVKVLDRFRYGLVMTTSALAEGTFEANRLYHTVNDNLHEAFFARYGRDPNEGEEKELRDWATTAGNVNLIANTALLTATNSLTLGSLFKPAAVLNKQLQAEVARGLKVGLKAGSTDVFEQVASQQLKKKGFSLIKDNVIRPAVSGLRTNFVEGVEEGSQFFFQRTAEDYYKRKFEDKSIDDNDNFTRSMGTALNDTFTTREGLENVLLGFMSGAVINGIRNYANNKRGVNSRRDQMVNTTLALLNSERVSGLFENTYNEAVTSNSLYASMHDALLGNDLHSYHNFKHQQLFNFVSSGVKAGRYDMRIGQLELMKELPQAEFEKLFNLDYTDANRRTVSEQVDGVISKANAIKENIDKVDAVFGKNPHNRKTNFLDHEAFETYKEQLALNLSEMQDNKERLGQLRDDLSKLAPKVGNERLLQMVSERGTEEIAKEFERRVTAIDAAIGSATAFDQYAPLQKERAFLEDKIATLRGGLETYDTDVYLKEVEEMMNYFTNNNSLNTNLTGENVSPIDVLEIVNKAYDSYRLINNTNAALYHYQQLTKKAGFDQYIAEVKTEIDNQQKRFGGKIAEQLGETGTAVATDVPDEDIQEVDDNGDPISPKPPQTPPAGPTAPTAPAAPQPGGTPTGTPATSASAQAAPTTTPAVQPPVELSTTDNSTEVTLPFEEAAAEPAEPTSKTPAQNEQPKQSDKPVEPVKVAEQTPKGEDTLTPEETAQQRPAREGTFLDRVFQVTNPFVLFNRLYSNIKQTQTKANLRKVLFSMSPAEIQAGITLKVKESTEGQKGTEIRPFEAIKGLFYAGYKQDVEVYVGKTMVGIMQPSDRLYFKRGAQYLTLDQMTQEEYDRLSGNDPNTYAQFMDHITKYGEMYEGLVQKFLSGKTEFSNKEVNGLFDVLTNYGNVRYSASAASATKISDLKYQGKGSVVISLPMLYNVETGVYERTYQPNLLQIEELSSEETADIWKYIADNIERLRDLNSRYIYLTKMPDGKFSQTSALAARPAETSPEALDSILDTIKGVGEKISSEQVRQINANLKDKIYIADSRNAKGNRTQLSLAVDEAGDVYLRVYNDKVKNRDGLTVKYNKRIRIPNAKTARNFEDFVNLINQKLIEGRRNDSQLDKLNLVLAVPDFKVSILEDENVTSNALANSLTVAAQPEIFDNYSISVFPKSQEKPQAKPKPKEKPQPKPPKEAKAKKAKAQPAAPAAPVSTLTEQEVLDRVYVAQDKESVKAAMQDIFNLSEAHSDAVAEVYDRMAQAWSIRTGNPKNDFYKTIRFEKTTLERLTGKEGFDTNKFQIIGEDGAKFSTLKMNNLQTAKEMEKQGVESDKIYHATGWERGVDDLWRTELDYTASLKPVYTSKFEFQEPHPQTGGVKKSYKLGEILRYDQLFKAYPDLKDVRVLALKPKLSDSVAAAYTYRYNGKVVPSRSVITLNGDYGSKVTLRSLMHEVQHIIQDLEGFAQGGSTETAMEASDIAYEQLMDEWKAANEAQDADRAEAANAKMSIFLTKLGELRADQLYHVLSGEVESRNVESRLKLAPFQREQRPLSWTEDVAREDQFVVMHPAEQALSKMGVNQIATEAFDFPNLKKLNDKGGTRDVYDLGAAVLKVAKNSKGLIQNEMEGSFTKTPGLLPRVLERGIDYVLVEKVDTNESNALLQSFGNGLSVFSYEDFVGKTTKLRDYLGRYGVEEILDRPLSYGDITSIENWGVKNGKIVLADAGSLIAGNIDQEYERRKNELDTVYDLVEDRRYDKGIKFQGGNEPQARAAIRTLADGTYVITALTDPNVSSPLHELAHRWEEHLTDPERASVLAWTGQTEWNTETSEKFARGFEKYLADGEAPSSALRELFDSFKQWLTEIYKGIVGSDIDVELNDAMKDIYAQMLGENYQQTIEEAEATENPAAPVAGPITRENIKTKQRRDADGNAIHDVKLGDEVIATIYKVQVGEGTKFNGWYKEGQEGSIGDTKEEAINTIIDQYNNTEGIHDESMPAAEDAAEVPESDIPVYEEEVFEREDASDTEVGDKVLYQGKEYKVIDKNTTASGRTMLTINDGTKYGDKIVDGRETGVVVDVPETTFDLVEEPVEDVTGTATERRFRDLDKEWVEDSKNDNETYDIAGLKTVLERLNQKFGLPYRIVKAAGNWKGRWKGGVVEINLNNFDKTTPFHEYLHPFVEMLKTDNPELYRNLVSEVKEMEGIREMAAEIKADPIYAGATSEEIGDEILVRVISDIAAKNVNPEGRRLKSQYTSAMKRLIDKFMAWFNKLWDKMGLRKVSVKEIPLTASLQDIADLISLHDIQFDFAEHRAIIDGLTKYQSNTAKPDGVAYKEMLERKIRVLEDTAKRRLNAPELIDQVIVARGVLKNFDPAMSLTNYGIEAINGVRYASDIFKRISGELQAGQGKLRTQDIIRLNKDLEVVKAMMAFWLSDAKYLFSRVVEDLDPQSYKRLAGSLRYADATVAMIHGKSIELATEWLFPYIEQVNKKIAAKHPELVITKEKFAQSMKYANSDIDAAFFLLGSVGSSTDAFSAVVSSAIKDVFEENHLYESELATKLKLAYGSFLEAKGLENNIKTTEQYYKDNYLRKATQLEQKRDNEGLPLKDKDGKPVYEYVERWAFHEEFYHDLFARDRANFIDSLGEQPDIADDPKGYQAWVDKVFAWNTANTQKIGDEMLPHERYRNPKFTALKSDPHFNLLYNSYMEGNQKLFTDEQLKYGIIPQSRRNEGFLAGVTSEQANAGIGSKAKTIAGKVWDKILPKTNESEFSDTQEELDGSLYKQIPVPFVNMVEEANLNFTLPETVLAFAGSSNLVSMKREIDPSLRTIKTIINGSPKLAIEARKITKVTSKRKTIFDHILKLPAKKEAQTERLNKQLNAFIDDVMYGANELRTTLNILGRPVDMNKLGANLSFLTALNNMAFNVTAGISNVTIGNFQTLGESIGSKYYKPADWRKAQADYFSNMGEYLKDAVSLRKSLITQLGIKYDAIQGEFRDKYGKKFVGSAMQRYGNLDTIFFLSHGAEHQIQLVGMLSLMNATKVKTTDGKEISLYDAHYVNKDGYLRLKDNVIWSKEQEREFTRQLHGLNKLLNGNYSKFDKATLQRTWWGKLLLVYRKFLYNGIRNRYGKQRVDYELGDVHEGYYRTFFKKLYSDVKDYKLEGAKRLFTKEGWNEDERYAYAKTVFELSSLTGMALLVMGMAAAGGGDKPKQKSWASDYLLLQSVRLRNDIGVYTIYGLSDMVRILQNPSAVINTLDKYAKFWGQLMFHPTEVYKRKTGQFDKGDSVLWAKFLKAAPLSRQIINLMSPDEQLKFYQLIGKN